MSPRKGNQVLHQPVYCVPRCAPVMIGHFVRYASQLMLKMAVNRSSDVIGQFRAAKAGRQQSVSLALDSVSHSMTAFQWAISQCAGVWICDLARGQRWRRTALPVSGCGIIGSADSRPRRTTWHLKVRFLLWMRMAGFCFCFCSHISS